MTSIAYKHKYPIYLDSHPSYDDPPPLGSIYNLDPEHGFRNSFVTLHEGMRRICDPDGKGTIVLSMEVCNLLAEHYGSVMYAYKTLMETEVHISHFSKIYISFDDEFLKAAIHEIDPHDVFQDVMLEFDEERCTFTWTILMDNKVTRGIPLTELRERMVVSLI